MLDTVISSSVLILTVIAVRFLFGGKTSCRLRYALWGLVLLRLIIPVPLPAGDFSVLNVLTVSTEVTPDTAPGVGDYLSDAPSGYTGFSDTVTESQSGKQLPSAVNGEDFTRIAVSVWVIGIPYTTAD